MYNMDISIFGYKINLEILILIGVVYLILVGHTVCGCCNMPGIMEALTTMDVSGHTIDISGNLSTAHAKKQQAVASKASAYQAKKEGFTGANTNYGQSSPYDLNSDIPINTNSWMQPNLTVTPGQQPSKAVMDIVNRKNGPIPLPEGEMLLFANTEFKPECCGSGGSTFSTSTGCACLNSNTVNYLYTRGGNNVPYSEY
jgi:hypothetical protein